MTSRVTAGEVKEIITTSVSDDIVFTNHIATANLLVDTHLSISGLAGPVLKQIELYLAAHFVSLTEERGGLTRSKMGDADESYANVYKEGFRSTRYGQMALALDSTGTLTRTLQTRVKAEFRVV